MTVLMLPAALVFGSLAWFATLLSARVCAEIPRFGDGPPAGTPPAGWLVAGAAVVGVFVSMHGTGIVQLLVLALACASLVAAWCSDVRCGIVPDAFTVVPLAALLALAIALQHWWIIASAVIPVLPFALAALVSKGRGMGWGDVKLVALGGALLGTGLAIAAFAFACLAAAAVYRLRGVRSGPIAFAPYLCAAIGISLALVGT